MHKRLKHGILGTSARCTITRHAKAEAAPAVKTLPEPIPVKKKMGRPPLDPSERKPRKKYSKRSTQVATIPEAKTDTTNPTSPASLNGAGLHLVTPPKRPSPLPTVGSPHYAAKLRANLTYLQSLLPEFTSFISGTHP